MKTLRLRATTFTRALLTADRRNRQSASFLQLLALLVCLVCFAGAGVGGSAEPVTEAPATESLPDAGEAAGESEEETRDPSPRSSITHKQPPAASPAGELQQPGGGHLIAAPAFGTRTLRLAALAPALFDRVLSPHFRSRVSLFFLVSVPTRGPTFPG